MFLILFIQNGAKYYLTDHVQFLVPLDSNTNLMRSPWQASKIRRETYYSSCCQSCISELNLSVVLLTRASMQVGPKKKVLGTLYRAV